MKKEISLPEYRTKKDIYYRDFLRFKNELNLIDGNEEQIVYSILKIFYSITKKTANELSAKQATTLVTLVNRALTDNTHKFQPVIKYNNKLYGFFNFEEITLGTLIDLERCYKENDLISLLSIVYRPIKGQINKKGEYTIEDYNGYSNELFSNIDLATVESVMSVFQKAFQILSRYTNTSTEKK